MAIFHLSIAEWYRRNARDLPWRRTKNPYLIWLSEIILQQTKVEQGLAYYQKFSSSYPTVQRLAEASEQDVLNLWQGLGYYSRARNLHFTAKQIVSEWNGEFPKSYATLLQLKGIGKYTAAAIASFSNDEAVAVVDGNVYRVLSRVFDIDLAIDSTAGKNHFFQLAQELIDTENPAEFNQAIMEFGALQCTPKKPNCWNCPLSENCLAHAHQTIAERPVKSKKSKVRNRFFHFLFFEHNGFTWIEQRTEKDIWQNLYQFPLIEQDENNEDFDIKTHTHLSPIHVSKPITHILSHQKIHAVFYHFDGTPAAMHDNWQMIKRENLQDFPLPRLIDRYLETTD
jgi:A/G-specific adenine glycosylase